MVNQMTETHAGKFKVELLKKSCLANEVECNSHVVEASPGTNFASLSKLNNHITELVENSVFIAFLELLKKISVDYQDRGITYEELHNRYIGFFKNDSNIFCDLLSSNVKHLDLAQLKQEIQTLGQKLPSLKAESPQPSPIHAKSPSPTPDVTDNIVIDPTKCYARTGTYKQCSRKKQKGGEYCGGHAHNQPYGRIDQPLNEEALQSLNQSQNKKRGRPIRPSSQKIDTEGEHEDTEHIVEMDAEIETIGGIDYLIDKATQNIYKSPQNLMNDGTLDANQLHLVGKKTGNDSVLWYSENDVLYMKKYGK